MEGRLKIHWTHIDSVAGSCSSANFVYSTSARIEAIPAVDGDVQNLRVAVQNVLDAIAMMHILQICKPL